MESIKKEFNENKPQEHSYRFTVFTGGNFTKPQNSVISSDIIKEIKEADENENYLKIDETNYFTSQNEDFKNFAEKYNSNRIEIFKKLNIIINKIFNKDGGTNINYNDDIFLISQNISKSIEKNFKIDKNFIDKIVKDMMGTYKTNLHRGDILFLDKKTCEFLGCFLCYCYTDSRLQQYKIKDANKLIELRKSIIKSGINVYKDFLDYCKENKGNDSKISFFWKKQRNKYICLPELIFLFNRYAKVKTVVFDINSFDELNEIKALLTQLTLLNINILLNSIKVYKINLIHEKFEKFLYLGYYTNKLGNFCKRHNEIFKKNNLTNKTNLFQQKWNFKDILDIKKTTPNNNNNNNNINNIIKKKEKAKSVGKKIEKKEKKEIKELKDIINDYINILEIIIVCFYSLINLDNYENLDLSIIINDAFTQEYLALFSSFYTMGRISDNINDFNIFDLLISKKIKFKGRFNLEINSLDITMFEKALTLILKNKLMTSLNISLFSSDIQYFPQCLYKICVGVWEDDALKENDSINYLYNDVTDFEKNILNKLSSHFIYHLSVFFEIIKNMVNLEELGINIDIPPNLKNQPNYTNPVLKFILNLLYYISINIKIKKFSLLSPKTILDSRKIPYINTLMNDINMSQAYNLIELSLKFQFYQISKINNLISTNLQILNIGYLDFESFKNLCSLFCNANFNKESCLQKLSIGLLNTIINFDIDLKFILRKLFSIKIKSLTSLSLYTNLILKDEIDYDYLLKILKDNWINEYLIALNSNSKKYFNNFSNDIKNINFFVPHSLEEKLMNPEDAFKYLKNPAIIDINKNKDKDDDAYWYLKYLFKNIYVDKYNDENRIKYIVMGILKYLYFQKNPVINIMYK